MKSIETAFQQLEFAWKLYNYVLEGRIDLDELDKPLTFQDEASVFVLRDKLLHTPNDLILACENNLTINFGAAAITLNRCREEAGIKLPDPSFQNLINSLRWRTKSEMHLLMILLNRAGYSTLVTLGHMSLETFELISLTWQTGTLTTTILAGQRSSFG